MPLALAPVFAVVMLVWANHLVRRNQKPTSGAVLVCIVFSGAPFFPVSCGMYSLPLLAQGLLTALALPLAFIPDRGPRVYRVTSAWLAVAAWLIAGVNVFWMDRCAIEWRAANPFESMEQRAPEPKSSGWTDHLADKPLWSDLECQMPRGEYARRLRGRSGALHIIHESRVGLFFQAAGFGIARMPVVMPREEHFGPDFTLPVPQPEGYEPNAVSLGDEMPADPQQPFAKLHTNSLLDFVNPDGWGYVKSRSEVAGFRPHRFSKVPKPVERWEVRRVELVGLLLHEKPAVYVSEHLPRMDELTGAKTREPDSFETEGLRAIRGEDDLFTRGDENAVRMVGAIRSVQQCVECHGGNRGDLLGAFSYRLRREGTK